MQAHGYSPGPTQRPMLTGAVSGVIGELAAIPLICYSGACRSLADAIGLSLTPTLALHALSMVLAGVLYGRIFMRAANDKCGGWLFGISYGFALWMLGPVTIIQWVIGRPVAIAIPAIGLMGTHLLYGLVLGLVFPWVHRLIQPKLGSRLRQTNPATLELKRVRRTSQPEERSALKRKVPA
ncbi:MAG: hypothetical protein AB1813_24550 [Verrucomicrobiota bacterium]